MSEPRSQAAPKRENADRGAAPASHPLDGFALLSPGHAATKQRLRAAWGIEEQQRIVEPPGEGEEKAPAERGEGGLPAELADGGKDSAATAKKLAGLGRAPDEIRRPVGRGEREYGPKTETLLAANHVDAVDWTGFIDAQGGVVARRNSETKPTSGDGAGEKKTAEVGAAQNGLSAKVGVDFISGQRPEDVHHTDPNTPAPIANQNLVTTGGAVGVTGIDGNAENVKTTIEAKRGHVRTQPDAEGKNVLKGSDVNGNVRLGAKGLEAANVGANTSTTTEDGTKVTAGGRVGVDTAKGTGTVGVSAGTTHKDGSGVSGSADLTLGADSVAVSGSGSVTTKDGARAGASASIDAAFSVTEPVQEGNRWVVTATDKRGGSAGVSGGKGAIGAGVAGSASEGKKVTRYFSTQQEAADFKASLEKAPQVLRQALLAKAADPAAMAVGDTHESWDSTGAGADVTAQSGVVQAGIQIGASSSSSVTLKKLSETTLEVTTVEASRENLGGQAGTVAGALGKTTSQSDSVMVRIELDLGDKRARAALGLLQKDGFEAFKAKFGAGEGTLWKRTLTQTKETAGDGTSASIAGLSHGRTSEISKTTTVDGEGNEVVSHKGTGKESASGYGDTYEKGGSLETTLENGEVDRVTLEANAKGSDSDDVARGMADMMGMRPGEAGRTEEDVAVDASANITDADLALLRTIILDGKAEVPVPGGGTREIGAWRLKAAVGGGEYQKLQNAARRGPKALAIALTRYQAEGASQSIAALVKTLSLQARLDVKVEGDDTLGQANDAEREAMLKEARAHLEAGRLRAARSTIDTLELRLRKSELKLNARLDPKLDAVPGDKRKQALDWLAQQRTAVENLKAQLASAEKAEAPKREDERKKDMNAAGADDRVCETPGAAGTKTVLAAVPAMFRAVDTPDHTAPEAKESSATRNQTLADPNQVDTEKLEAQKKQTAADAAFAAAETKLAALDTAWSAAEETFEDFRILHYGHYRLHSGNGIPFRKRNETTAPDAAQNRSLYETVDKGTTNLRGIRGPVAEAIAWLATKAEKGRKDEGARADIAKQMNRLFPMAESSLRDYRESLDRMLATLRRIDLGTREESRAKASISFDYLR